MKILEILIKCLQCLLCIKYRTLSIFLKTASSSPAAIRMYQKHFPVNCRSFATLVFHTASELPKFSLDNNWDNFERCTGKKYPKKSLYSLYKCSNQEVSQKTCNCLLLKQAPFIKFPAKFQNLPRSYLIQIVGINKLTL